MIDFQILVLLSLTLLTVAMFIFYCLVITNQLHKRKKDKGSTRLHKGTRDTKGQRINRKTGWCSDQTCKGID